MTPALLDYIRRRRACAQGMAIAEQHENLTESIRACPLEYKLWAVQHLLPQRIRVGIAAYIARRTPLADGRTVYDLMTDERSRAALDVCDRYAVGATTDDDLAAARAAAWDAETAAWDATSAAAWDAARDAAGAAARAAARAADAAARAAARAAAWAAAESWQSAYLDSLDWDAIVAEAIEMEIKPCW